LTIALAAFLVQFHFAMPVGSLITLMATAGAQTKQTKQAKEPAPDRWQLMNLMHTFERELSALRPYLVSDEKFQDPKAKPEIQKSLDSLESAVKSARPPTIETNPGLNLNFSMMSYHIQRTKRVFERGNYEYARRNLNATTGFCVTCHTQTPVPKASLGGLWVDPTSEPVSLESAEFLFITRRFDLALERYDQLARKFPKSGLQPGQLADVYNRKVALFARVMRDPQAAIENLKKDLENKELPADIQTNLKAWIGDFERWKNESPKLTEMSRDVFLEHVRKIRPTQTRTLVPSDPDLVRNLRISGLLYEHLMKDPSGDGAQEILYDLALFERQLAKLYWYSPYQSYLRECVLKFPKKPLSKSCFEMYESEVTEQFAGRSALPEDVRSSLEALRRTL